MHFVTDVEKGYKAGNIKQNTMQRLRSTFSVQFYCRESKAKNGLAPIEVGVNLNGSRFFYNLPRRGKPGSYLKTERQYLATIENRLRNYELECEVMTVEGLKAYIRNGYAMPGKTVRDLVDDFYVYLQKKVNAGQLSFPSYNKYRTAIGAFVEGLDQGKPVSSVTPGYVDSFCTMIDTRYENSTGVGMKTKVKTFLNYAVMNQYIAVSPWQNKIRKKVKKILLPTPDEYRKIVDLDLSFNTSLERVRDIWVFASGCGLSYCDCAALEDGDIQQKDGMWIINKTRGKTGVEFYSVLLPEAIAIYEKYGQKLPRMVSNQKINSYIKVVGEMAGIGVSLHFHLARHIYCHRLLNEYRMSYEISAKCLGHQNVRQTQHYGKVFNTTVLEEFKNAFDKM